MVMTVLTRQQFRQHWENVKPGLGADDSPLWTMEYKKKSRWFVCVRPVYPHSSELIVDGVNPKQQFWLWCNRHCAGQVLCYASDLGAQEEWWGFSHRADIVLWMLKWSQ